MGYVEKVLEFDSLSGAQKEDVWYAIDNFALEAREYADLIDNMNYHAKEENTVEDVANVIKLISDRALTDDDFFSPLKSYVELVDLVGEDKIHELLGDVELKKQTEDITSEYLQDNAWRFFERLDDFIDAAYNHMRDYDVIIRNLEEFLQANENSVIN